MTSSDNAIAGMGVGPMSLVKDSVAQRNGGSGIVVGDQSQVENCVAGNAEAGPGVDGNRRFGVAGTGSVSGGLRILITRTTANGNGNSGISIGSKGTVTRSTASNNTGPGIAFDEGGGLVTYNTTNDNGNTGIFLQGTGHTVSYNTANDNGGDGIRVECPSTVTNNTASNNTGENFNFAGDNCFTKNNTSPDEGTCVEGDAGMQSPC